MYRETSFPETTFKLPFYRWWRWYGLHGQWKTTTFPSVFLFCKWTGIACGFVLLLHHHIRFITETNSWTSPSVLAIIEGSREHLFQIEVPFLPNQPLWFNCMTFLYWSKASGSAAVHCFSMRVTVTRKMWYKMANQQLCILATLVFSEQRLKDMLIWDIFLTSSRRQIKMCAKNKRVGVSHIYFDLDRTKKHRRTWSTHASHFLRHIIT